ncbi:MAG: hypothetical protein ABI920_10380 [Casimicrobiaceae bacterium]
MSILRGLPAARRQVRTGMSRHGISMIRNDVSTGGHGITVSEITRPMTSWPFRLDRTHQRLSDDAGRTFDLAMRSWVHAPEVRGEGVDATTACAWLQRESGAPCRVPIGVIGPREATAAQMSDAAATGRGLATMGLAILCGGREGVMHAASQGAAAADGVTIGLLPDADPDLGNPHLTFVIATGIGEARNALIARASLCLVAIGNSHGTLSEVALARHFGKLVIGLAGAADVPGVCHVQDVGAALDLIARCVLDPAGTAVHGRRP